MFNFLTALLYQTLIYIQIKFAIKKNLQLVKINLIFLNTSVKQLGTLHNVIFTNQFSKALFGAVFSLLIKSFRMIGKT